MDINKVNTQQIHASWLDEKRVYLDVLRLDKIHPVVSGNKWFKLKYFLQEAAQLRKSTVATFGGAWSNHVVATAFACQAAGLKSAGIIRGEEPRQPSATLKAAKEYGMELHFVTRDLYRDKEALKAAFGNETFYWIDEGGYGPTGAKGASEILTTTDPTSYTHIIASVGTGTTLAGILLSSANTQQVLGISSMKGNNALAQHIAALTGVQPLPASFQIIHDYHFGGYGKHPHSLIEYINNIYRQFQLPLDIVYTGKTFYAIEDLVKKGFFGPHSRLLMLHTGGLQGNNSLSSKVLAF